tara:strand:+ start:974 stop:1291 length:318 start_codon:yes stop_codon:yes gene_type:complete
MTITNKRLKFFLLGLLQKQLIHQSLLLIRRYVSTAINIILGNLQIQHIPTKGVRQMEYIAHIQTSGKVDIVNWLFDMDDSDLLGITIDTPPEIEFFDIPVFDRNA